MVGYLSRKKVGIMFPKQPSEYLDNVKYRRHAYGTERRRNMSKYILDYGTPLPKPIEYADIDQAVFDWVDKVVDLSYDGKRLPTYRLYSTQRISEYMQSWKELDETGNIIMNFKMVTREFNPQKGDEQGNYFNIPGHKDFAMFYVPVLQENGVEAFDKYTMKQPTCVNLIYTASIITNKMELMNKMNEKMVYEFNAINCYISPNGHPMPMSLEDISDESEYNIDDRKYYAQSFKIKVKGYIIRKEDYKVERIPSRFVVTWNDSEIAGSSYRRGKNRRENEKVVFLKDTDETYDKNKFILDALKQNPCEIAKVPTSPKPPLEDTPVDADWCCEKEQPRYEYKVMRVIMNFDDCVEPSGDTPIYYHELSFEIDKDMTLITVETENIHDFKILVNGEVMSLDNEVKFLDGDEITARISKDDDFSKSVLTLVGYDPNTTVDTKNIAETVLDEPYTEEEIIVGM